MTSEDTCGHPTTADSPCQLTPSREDGRCHHHTTVDDQQRGGRPSKLEDVREDILESARNGVSVEGCARSAGIHKSTLYDWINNNDDFSDAFKRARAQGENHLVRAGLSDPDTDTSMARFLLERSFGYSKKEEIEHSGDGGGIMIFTEADDDS